MTKDVLVSIKGLQSIAEETEPDEVEVVSKGEYYFKNGHHFIYFDEMMEGVSEPIKNSIKITEKGVEVKKKGPASVQMNFEENKKNVTYYVTPFGTLQIGISATRIDLQEKEDNMNLCIDYALEINGEHTADCEISICVQEKDSGNFSL